METWRWSGFCDGKLRKLVRLWGQTNKRSLMGILKNRLSVTSSHQFHVSGAIPSSRHPSRECLANAPSRPEPFDRRASH